MKQGRSGSKTTEIRLKREIHLAILQSDLEWENPQTNLAYFEQQVISLDEQIDLALLPETYSTGFTMRVKEFADRDEEVLGWMKRVASGNGVHLAGSCIVMENDHYYNRLYCVSPDGGYVYYDKRHLFRMGREQEYFSPGNQRVIVRIGKFRVLLQICYDLRFPVFARNRGDYDAILYVANWPAVRNEVWDILLRARAIENQAYVIGVNRTGKDGEGMDHLGGSCLIDPKGNVKARLDDQPGLLLSSMNYSKLESFRKDFPAAKDADDFKLL